MIIRALHSSDWAQLKKTLDIAYTSETGGMVLEEDGEILAASVFDGWTYNSVNMHMMIKNPRAMLETNFHRAVFDYIFTTTNRKTMLGFIAESNVRSLRLAKRFGSVEKTRIKDGFSDGVDLVITELHRNDCPYWAGVENDTESTKAA